MNTIFDKSADEMFGCVKASFGLNIQFFVWGRPIKVSPRESPTVACLTKVLARLEPRAKQTKRATIATERGHNKSKSTLLARIKRWWVTLVACGSTCTVGSALYVVVGMNENARVRRRCHRGRSCCPHQCLSSSPMAPYGY